MIPTPIIAYFGNIAISFFRIPAITALVHVALDSTNRLTCVRFLVEESPQALRGQGMPVDAMDFAGPVVDTAFVAFPLPDLSSKVLLYKPFFRP